MFGFVALMSTRPEYHAFQTEDDRYGILKFRDTNSEPCR